MSVRRTRRAALRVALRIARRVALLIPLGVRPAVGQVDRPPIQLGVRVHPETVTVGDPFRVALRVRVPREATIEFPAVPDTGNVVEALDPRRVQSRRDPTAVDQIATYRLAAWDVGERPIRLGDVVVRAGGREWRVPPGALRVVVRSVLPADSAKRVPRPPRGIVEFGAPWWKWLIALLAAAALAALLGWWWWRRRRGQAAERVDPYARALQGFQYLQEMRLPDAGEPGRHVVLAVEVMRDYLAARVPDARLSLTTRELLEALAARGTVPRERLARALGEADLVKFARAAVDVPRSYALAHEAQAIVETVEERVREAERQAAGAAAAERRAA